ncbi:MAG: hypothetical protein APF80_13175 [Alphaproteobacteria bacterium BRH_c36]|nr:MAG: hypothetical protein APF80_13175 [Alphaproteobacteria bacterium BRH_c36]
MADVRSSPGDTQNDISSSSRLPRISSAAHASGGGEQKATIRKAPPESRPRTQPPLDPDSPDDLTGIRGIDRALADKLRRTGITHFDQIADWSPTDVRSLSAALSLGRSIYAQNWIEQAARLAQLRRDAGTPASPGNSARAEGRNEFRQPRSIPSLVASAASAIRARVRMNEPGQPPRMIDPLDLATRISVKFRQIGTAAGIAASAFPEQAIRHPVKTEADPETSSKTGPELAAILDPVKVDWASSAAAIETATDVTADAAPVEAAPQACVPAVHAAEAAPQLPDELCLISNLPQYVADRLNALGIRYFSEIASFNADDIAALSVDCALGERVNRECWVEQAEMLATGAVTKAARRRARGAWSCLTAYPSPPLERDPEAFAALIPPTAVSHSDKSAPDIEADERSSTQLPPVATALDHEKLVKAEPEGSAQKQAPAQTPFPDAPGWATPPSVDAVAPLPAEAAASIAGPAGQTGSNCERQHAPAAATIADRRDDYGAGFPDHEEAQVTIRPRTPCAFSASADISRFEGGSHLYVDDFAEPECSTSQLSQCDPSVDSDCDEQAGYLRRVGEALVEIVPARAATPPQPGQTAAPDSSAASTLAGIAAAPKSVSRFLKALRGH